MRAKKDNKIERLVIRVTQEGQVMLRTPQTPQRGRKIERDFTPLSLPTYGSMRAKKDSTVDRLVLRVAHRERVLANRIVSYYREKA